MTRGRIAEDAGFKPIGLALAAVVAGLGPVSGEGAAEAIGVARDSPAPAPADFAAEQDDVLLLGPSDPVEPFADPPASATQLDVFDL